MPKSKVRKKNDFTINPVSRTPVKVKAGPSSVWFVVLFVGLMLIGLVFHDHRFVAHDALAVAPPTQGMNLTWSPRVTRLATSWSSDHTDVIHPHWG